MKQPQRRRQQGESERGSTLAEFMIGALLATVTLGSVVTLTVSNDRLRRTDEELRLAHDACRKKLEELRATPFDQIAALDGADFDIAGSTGSLNALPDDADGKCGEVTVAVDTQTGGETLYRVTAEAVWTGVSGRRRWSLMTLIGNRRR